MARTASCSSWRYSKDVQLHSYRDAGATLSPISVVRSEARDPDVYSITRVNMGDRPVAANSAEAIYMTADRNATRNPEVARLLKLSTYVDDIV